MLLITSRSYVVVFQYTVFAFVLVRDSKKKFQSVLTPAQF